MSRSTAATVKLTRTEPAIAPTMSLADSPLAKNHEKRSKKLAAAGSFVPG